jgi:carbonic anhydrase/acetyltransferase-like protein (isoleucine patch superfamily)
MKFEHGYNGSLITFKGMAPKIHPSAFLCEGVKIIGDVSVGKDASIWYNTVVRGDVHHIIIGEGTNVQDLSMLHVTNSKFALEIGNFVSIGHSVTLHGCTVKDSCLIGIGANVLDGAVVNSHSLVAAGSLVREGFVVPEGVLVAGVPAKIVRDLSEEEINRVKNNAHNYIKYSAEFRASIGKVNE